LNRNLPTSNQLERLAANAFAFSDRLWSTLSVNPALTPEIIHKLLATGTVPDQTLGNLTMHDNFRPEHLDSMRAGFDRKPTENYHYISRLINSEHVDYGKHVQPLLNDPEIGKHVLETLLRSPHAYSNPEVFKLVLNSRDDLKQRWASNLAYQTNNGPWDNDTVKAALMDKTIAPAILKSYPLDAELAHYALANAPINALNIVHGHTPLSLDAKRALLPRVQAGLDSFAATENAYREHPGAQASNILLKMLDPTNRWSIDWSPEELEGIVRKHLDIPQNSNGLGTLGLVVQKALEHPNIPESLLVEFAKKECNGDHKNAPCPLHSSPNLNITLAEELHQLAKARVGIFNPDITHNEQVKIKFDMNKARKIRDIILGTGQKELKPKEIPNLPANWKIGRAKNGNINADLIQKEIDSAPEVMYNISHSEYGEDRQGASYDRDTCPDCGGDGHVDSECSSCEGTGRPSTERCEQCDGEGKPTYECSECDGSGEDPDADEKIACPTCDGQGQYEGETCTSCGGNGEVDKTPEQQKCSVCGGKGQIESDEDCEYCDGQGRRPPLCSYCDGTGKRRVGSQMRDCNHCDGERYAQCEDCEGSGQQNERCERCDGNGEVGGDMSEEEAYKEAIGDQQHNLKPSQVLQLNFTTDQVKKMKEAGVWGTFRSMYEAYTNTSHPVTPTTIGWVRYTYGGDHTGKPRYYADEIQSDFGQSFVRQAINQGIEQGMTEAADKGLEWDSPEWAQHVREWAEKAKKTAEEKWPEAHHKKIAEILFGNTATGKPRHSNEVLFEAFFQHLRNKNQEHAIVSMPHVFLKAKIALRRKLGTLCESCGQSSATHRKHPDFDRSRFNVLSNQKPAMVDCPACKGSKSLTTEGGNKVECSLCQKFSGKVDCQFKDSRRLARTDAPGHYNITYHDVPVSAGLEPGTYGDGDNPDESNPHLRGLPTHKGPVRKFEEEIDGSNLLRKADPFGEEDWTTST
jgi:hypothetical protein